jgi:hypothetical protein
MCLARQVWDRTNDEKRMLRMLLSLFLLGGAILGNPDVHMCRVNGYVTVERINVQF